MEINWGFRCGRTMGCEIFKSNWGESILVFIPCINLFSNSFEWIMLYWCFWAKRFLLVCKWNFNYAEHLIISMLGCTNKITDHCSRNYSTPQRSSVHSLRTIDFFTELDLSKDNVPEASEQGVSCAFLI